MLRMIVLHLALALTASPAMSQTFLPDPAEQTAFAIQWEKPLLDDFGTLASYSSIVEVDVIFPLNSGESLQVGIPLALAGGEGLDGTSMYAGNLRATLLYGDPENLRGFIGVTLPTGTNVAGPEGAGFVGLFSWVQEPEKWIDDLISLRVAVMPSRELEGGGRLGLSLGGAAVAPDDFDNLTGYLRLAAWGRVPAGSAELRGDLGTALVVNGEGGLGRRSVVHLNVAATLPELSGNPGLFIRVPIDDDARVLHDLSVGLMARF
jgi:hypothetical protein